MGMKRPYWRTWSPRTILAIMKPLAPSLPRNFRGRSSLALQPAAMTDTTKVTRAIDSARVRFIHELRHLACVPLSIGARREFSRVGAAKKDMARRGQRACHIWNEPE